MTIDKRLLIGGLAAAGAGALFLMGKAKAEPEPEPEPGEAKIFGLVLDESGNPLAGVSVFLADKQTKTDSSGKYSFTFREFIADNYVIVFSKDGYESKEGDVFIGEGDREQRIYTLFKLPPEDLKIVVVKAATQLKIMSIHCDPFIYTRTCIKDWDDPSFDSAEQLLTLEIMNVSGETITNPSSKGSPEFGPKVVVHPLRDGHEVNTWEKMIGTSIGFTVVKTIQINLFAMVMDRTSDGYAIFRIKTIYPGWCEPPEPYQDNPDYRCPKEDHVIDLYVPFELNITWVS